MKCISGVVSEKAKALTHPYPSLVNKIEKYGYDAKQLHHIVRLYEFLNNYISGMSYEKCLKTNNKEYLIDIKKFKTHSLEQAKNDCKKYHDLVKEISNDFINNNKLIVNENIKDFIYDITCNIFKIRFKEELI